MPWEVYVQGDQGDLDLIAQVLASGDPTLRRVGDSFVLTSVRLEDAADHVEVARVASSILDVMSGAARVVLDSPGGFSVGRVAMLNPNGSRTNYATLEGSARIREHLEIRKNGDLVVSPADPIPGFMRIAMQDDAVVAALERLRDPESWWVLYNVYEIVRDDAGGNKSIKERGWATMADLSRFRSTACSPHVLGTLARHGVQDSEPPSNPMAFNDAVQFVRRLVRQWMLAKATNLEAPTA